MSNQGLQKVMFDCDILVKSLQSYLSTDNLHRFEKKVYFDIAGGMRGLEKRRCALVQLDSNGGSGIRKQVQNIPDRSNSNLDLQQPASQALQKDQQ